MLSDWIMCWGSHALVLEPESLREEIRTEVETLNSRPAPPVHHLRPPFPGSPWLRTIVIAQPQQLLAVLLNFSKFGMI